MRIGTYATKGSGRPEYRECIWLWPGSAIDLQRAMQCHQVNSKLEANGLATFHDQLAGNWWLSVDAAGILQTIYQVFRECVTPGQATGGGNLHTCDALVTDRVGMGPPVASPGKIIATGRNYSDHLSEGATIWAKRGRAVKQMPIPIGFSKVASSMVGPGENVRMPPGETTIDYEVELAVIIGKFAKSVPPDDALSCVLGYTICNDISCRRLQFMEMEGVGLLLSKNFPTFCPIGPWIETADQLPPGAVGLTIELLVNGSCRQRANTEDMIFPVGELVSHWSQMTLSPGDIILTGTPSGVAVASLEPESAYLRPGDDVSAHIEGIGTLQNHIAGPEAN